VAVVAPSAQDGSAFAPSLLFDLRESAHTRTTTISIMKRPHQAMTILPVQAKEMEAQAGEFRDCRMQ